MERFIYLRATYFPLLLKVYKDTVLQVADDDDDDSNFETSRNILQLAVNLLQQQNVLDDLGGLDQYLHIGMLPASNDVAATGIQEAWSTILQQSAEVETAQLMQPASRTANLWDQYEQTIFMSLRAKKIAELRELAATETPDANTTGMSKDIIARTIPGARIATLKASEGTVIKKLGEELANTAAIDIRGINRDQPEGANQDGPDANLPFRSLDRCVADACTPSGFSEAMQHEIVEKCSALTAHIQRHADIGRNMRNMLLVKTIPPKGFKGLAALVPADAAKPLRLFLRGTISPSTVTPPSSAVVVMPDVGELTVNGKTIGLTLLMTKDQSVSSSWSGCRFCPATLVSESKEAKPGKGNGKGGKVAADSPSPTPRVTLTLTADDESVDVSPTIDGSVAVCLPVRLKLYSLCGEVPSVAADADVADRIMDVEGPSFKRPRDAASDDATAAKRKRASKMLFTEQFV